MRGKKIKEISKRYIKNIKFEEYKKMVRWKSV